MTGIPQSDWLYTRGAQSVRIVREESSDGCRLFIHGPGTDVVTHEFPNVTDCMKRQAEIEQRLLVAWYQLAASSANRRSEHGSWQGPDQRRAAS
jgi:hypothetical protein